MMLNAPRCSAPCGGQHLPQCRMQWRLAFSSVARRHMPRPHIRRRAADDQQQQDGNGAPSEDSSGELNEEVLARLAQKDEELAELKRQLERAKGIQEASGQRSKPRGPRIDGADLKRENLFDLGSKQRGSWVQERDLEFFRNAADGPLELAAGRQMSVEEKATVTLRAEFGSILMLTRYPCSDDWFWGWGFAAVAGALALVPIDTFTSRPSKPLFFFLTPLIRVTALLGEADTVVQNAEWDDLRFLLQRIEGPPCNLRENLQSAAAALSDAAARDKAKTLAQDVLEYVNAIDYDKYFDAQGRRGSKGGKQEAQFVEFSAASVTAAKSKLASFLAVFPREDVDAAREQAAPRFGE